ncbi:MAG: tetratricopeptide repeat protein [Gammaproteobacteria bacterium]|nr:tetratricopeptide repeat protein [Gammaproteobacteria bacterium]
MEKSPNGAAAEIGQPTSLADIPFASRPAVAVLPFVFSSEDTSQSYIADGITEDITTLLSYWRWLPVIAFNSARQLTDENLAATDAGRKLGAEYVVVGSVRGTRKRLRITSELIDANSGRQLWTRRFDKDLGNLFEIQDEIAAEIANNIEPELERAEQRRAMRKPPTDMGAWECVARAGALLTDLTREHVAEARSWAEKAIDLDPAFSHAHSLLASCHWMEGIFGWSADPASAFDACEASARRAVIVDDADWMAHAYLGISSLWNRRAHDVAIAEFGRALELNPSAAQAHHGFACALEFAGRPDEALPHLKTVLRLDPSYRNRAALLGDFALSHLLLGNYEAALDFAEQSVAAMPEYARGLHRLAAILGHLGRKDDARSARDNLLKLQPDFSKAYIESTYPFREQRDLERLLTGLRKAGLI